MYKLMVVALMMGGCSVSQAQEWKDAANWKKVPAPRETKDVVYFPQDAPGYTPTSQLLDVYENSALPEGQAAPVLVYLHGGGWMNGRRPESYDGFRPWLSAGFSVVNVEYRLVETVPSAVAPAAVQDVGCMLAWVKANAAKYHLDTSRVVTYGTSAGGHLALLAAVLPKDSDVTLPQCRDQVKVAAVLDFYGPYHLEHGSPGLYDGGTKRWIPSTSLPDPETMRHTMSPSTYIRAGIPPVFQAHGDADATVSYQASVELKKDLDRAGVKNAFTTVAGGGHGRWTPEELERVEMDSLLFLRDVGVVK